MLSKTRPTRPYEIPAAFREYGVPSIINGLLKTDTLVEAEKVTGESYKTSKATIGLGFLMMQELARDKEKLLNSNEDTVFSMGASEWKSVIARIGFKDILNLPFVCEGIQEELVLAWLEPGIILRYDTFDGHRNSADIYYSWKPDPDVIEAHDTWEFISSGTGCDDNIWMGSHDAREALRFHLHRLFQYGTFISPWPKRQFLWFLHYGDTKNEGYDYHAITEKRIEMLPPEIIKSIYPEEILA